MRAGGYNLVSWLVRALNAVTTGDYIRAENKAYLLVIHETIIKYFT